MLGFEDLFGKKGSTAGGNYNLPNDRDFNDLVVVVVDVGKNNLASVPEPVSAIALLSVGAVSLLKLRHRRHK